MMGVPLFQDDKKDTVPCTRIASDCGILKNTKDPQILLLSYFAKPASVSKITISFIETKPLCLHQNMYDLILMLVFLFQKSQILIKNIVFLLAHLL